MWSIRWSTINYACFFFVYSLVVGIGDSKICICHAFIYYYTESKQPCAIACSILMVGLGTSNQNRNPLLIKWQDKGIKFSIGLSCHYSMIILSKKEIFVYRCLIISSQNCILHFDFDDSCHCFLMFVLLSMNALRITSILGVLSYLFSSWP